MSQLLEFEGTWEELAQHEPEFRGKKLRLMVIGDVTQCADEPEDKRAPTARELMRMPAEERSRLLTAQALLAEPLYRSDPELTAFEAFGEEDFYDEYPTNALNKQIASR